MLVCKRVWDNKCDTYDAYTCRKVLGKEEFNPHSVSVFVKYFWQSIAWINLEGTTNPQSSRRISTNNTSYIQKSSQYGEVLSKHFTATSGHCRSAPRFISPLQFLLWTLDGKFTDSYTVYIIIHGQRPSDK